MVNNVDSRGFSLCLILRSSILPRRGRLRGHFFLPIYRMLSPPYCRFGQKSRTVRPAFSSVSWPFPSFLPGSTISPRSAAVEPLRLIQCYFNKTFLRAQDFFSNISLYTVLFLKNFCVIYVTAPFLLVYFSLSSCVSHSKIHPLGRYSSGRVSQAAPQKRGAAGGQRRFFHRSYSCEKLSLRAG